MFALPRAARATATGRARPHASTRRRRLAGLLAGGTVGLLAMAAPIASSASTSHAKAQTPLQKGLAFYRGKTITFIEPASTGGPFDLLARAEAPFLASYLHATVNVEDITPGNGIPGQDAIASASPDGLTIGLLNPLNDVSLVLTNTPGLNFNPARLAWIAQAGATVSVLVSTPSSPYTSFNTLLHATSPVPMLTQTTGTVNTVLRTWMGVLGIPIHWISGYGTLAAEVQGFQRGDGQVAGIALTNSGSLIAGGQARPLAVNFPPPPGTAYRSYLIKLPTIAQTFQLRPPKTAKQKAQVAAMEALNQITGDPTVTQTAVASDKVTALRAAATWMFKQQAFKTVVLDDGLNPTYVDPVTAKQYYITSLQEGKLVVCFIAGTC